MEVLTARPRLRASAVLAGALVMTALTTLAACGGSDSTAPTPTGCAVAAPRGSMTAQVNGAAFSAGFSTSATVQNSSANGPNIVQVNGVGCPETVGGSARQILITVGRLTPLTPGTYQLDAASQGQPALSGYSGIGQYVVAPNLWYSNMSDASGAGSGSITFTTISSTRVAGTFQLVLASVASNATAARTRVTVTSGAFDIPIP